MLGETVAVGRLPRGVVLVVLFVFAAWSLRVAFVELERSVTGEVLRVGIFVGPALVYLLLVERTNPLRFLRLNEPGSEGTGRVLLLLGTAFVAWYAFLDFVLGDGRVEGVALATVLFTVLSPATLVEEVFFRGFLLNKLWQYTGFWSANAASSLLFALIHIPGWYALGRFGSPQAVAIDALGIFVFGLVFGWAMRRTGSLWPAYLLHALSNLLIVAVLGA